MNWSSNKSLKIDEDLFNSLNILEGGFAPFILLQSVNHWLYKLRKSFSNSAIFFSFSTVLMITPKPLGLNSSISFFNLSRSFPLFIFCETEIRLDKGIKTKNLPAKESSELILGPLVEIGSLIQ